jgi:putative ABC transport system permease protein
MRTFFWDTIEAAGIAFVALKSNKIRAILATLGIVIGVMTVVLMVTIVAGLNRSFANQLRAIGSGTVYVERHPWLHSDDFYIYRNRPRITLDDYEQVRKSSQYASATAPEAASMRAVAFRSEKLQNIYITGTTEDYLKTTDTMPEVGRFISATDVAANRDVAVIGTGIADKLFEQHNPIGQRIQIGPYHYKVVGILEEQGTIFGFSLDDRVIVPLGSMLKHFGRRRDITIIVKAEDPNELDDLKDELTGIMRRSRGLGPGERDNFSINEQGQLMEMYVSLTSGIYAAGVIIGGIALLVGGIGIMNIMLVSVTERTHEIGIRKALGARKGQILRQFLIESALICTFGGIIGIGLAWGSGKAISQWLPVAMPLSVALGGMAFAAFVGIFFGLFPAAKASRMDPIVALRRE